MKSKPLVGISTCLLGEKVRYDGGHKLNHYLKDILGKYVEFVPVCPEFECGLPIPREAMRLVEQDGKTKLMTQKTEQDMTPQMLRWMKPRIAELKTLPLCGFIFKSKSPSSGLFRVKVYNEKGMADKKGRGIFAQGVVEAFPFLPMEEDGRLNDDKLRENFIERIFAMQRWQNLCAQRKSLGGIMDFHAQHKYMLMAHNPKSQKELGVILANAKGKSLKTVYDEYSRIFFTALAQIATVKKNTNVLQHIMGYFKEDLNKEEKAELKELIEQYHDELIPLIVPVTLLNHYVRKYHPAYLENQYYLTPHPMELMLRNHV